MEQSFSFKRSLLIVKSILTINKWNLILIFLISGVIISFFGIRGSVGIDTPITYLYLNIFIITVMSLRIFIKYRDKLYVNTSHMLPASLNEKFFVPFFMSLILLPLVLYVLYVTLHSSFFAFSLLRGNEMSYIDTIITISTGENSDGKSSFLLPFNIAFFHSIGWICSVLFKKNAFLGFIAIFFIVNIAFRMFNIYLGAPTTPYTMFMLSMFFWITSYIIFRKIQLNK